MVRSDIGGNISRLAQKLAADPSTFASLFAIVLDDIEKGDTGATSCTKGLLWLKRSVLARQAWRLSNKPARKEALPAWPSPQTRKAWAAQPCLLLSVTCCAVVSTVPTPLMLACRAMEFVASLLRRLEADKDVTLSTAASDAYAETLHSFHGWITSAAFYVALKVRQA